MPQKREAQARDAEPARRPDSGSEGSANSPHGRPAPAGQCGLGDVTGCDTGLAGNPQAQAAQRPGGAPTTGAGDLAWSEEAKNQDATSGKSRAESGTTAPSKT